jgi:hypothetical protein
MVIATGQALALWLFLPVRPGVGTNDTAPGATMRGPNTGTGA